MPILFDTEGRFFRQVIVVIPPTIRNPMVRVDQSITYTVTAATPDGCEATATIAIKVYGTSDIFVPNAFTPNGDGHNDVLRATTSPVAARYY